MSEIRHPESGNGAVASGVVSRARVLANPPTPPRVSVPGAAAITPQVAAARHRRDTTMHTLLLRIRRPRRIPAPALRHVVAWAEPWDWDTDDD